MLCNKKGRCSDLQALSVGKMSVSLSSGFGNLEILFIVKRSCIVYNDDNVIDFMEVKVWGGIL
ncbi:MAG: hypothetical protein OSJ61_12935 [Lachnospiraceae bacterium]|nr:hypothetical protein [Lachnospiraceae bacterium]